MFALDARGFGFDYLLGLCRHKPSDTLYESTFYVVVFGIVCIFDARSLGFDYGLRQSISTLNFLAQTSGQ